MPIAPDNIFSDINDFADGNPLFEERDDGWYYHTPSGWVGPFDDAREADCHHDAWASEPQNVNGNDWNQ